MHTALREGVLYVPGQFCYLEGAGVPVPVNEARLSFGVASPEQLREGVRRLARAFRAQVPGARREVAGVRGA